MMRKRLFVSSYLSFVWTIAILVLLYAFFRHTLFLLLAVFVLSLPAISYVYTTNMFKNITFDMDFYPFEAVKGGECVLNISINNPSRFPFPSLEFTFYTESPMYGERIEQTHVIPIKAGLNKFTHPFYISKCGLYEAGITGVTGYDLFHLFKFEKEAPITSTVRVFPEKRAITEPHEALYTEGFDEFEESAKSGNVSSNVTDIREYQPGDRLQRIHWKLSQKIDKLMVKENESTSTNEFFILAELYQPGFKESVGDKNLYNALDMMFENAADISHELMEAGQPFMLAFYSTRTSDFIISRVRTEEELKEAFLAAYYEPVYEEENLAKDVYEKAGFNKGTLIHVTYRGIEDA